MATTTTPADLPDSVEELRALVLRQSREKAQLREEKILLVEEKTRLGQKLEATIAEYRAENERLAEYVRLLKSQRFGRSSERSDPPDQP